MKDRVICINCLEELDPNLSRCPHCGSGTVNSKGIYSYLKRCEARGIVPTTDFLMRRYRLSLDAAHRILSAYFEDELTDEHVIRPNTKIEKIRVTKLFGYLDYEIDFNKTTSIILAPNGFGKTTIFNFIDFILNPSIEGYEKSIKGVPFGSFEIELNDNRIVVFSSEDSEDIFLFRTSDKEESKIIRLVSSDTQGSEYVDESIDRDRVGQDGIRTMVEMLKKAGIISDVFFIKTSRAFEDSPSKVSSPAPFKTEVTRTVRNTEPEEKINPMASCNQDLVSLMAACKKAYQKLTEDVKNELPGKFIDMDGPIISPKETKTLWNKYKNRLNELSEYGLIDAGNVSDFVNKLSESEYSDTTNGKGAFLSLYVTEYMKTLAPFDELYNKMKIFRDIINERNFGTKKHIEYSYSGIEYFNGDQKIRLESLSSGERNDFIMFFDMIFRTSESSVVLIDEPEISLHINWQEKYIDNVEKALAGKDCQVIISTHSPDIISTHDDCIVELKLVSDIEEGAND